jgi:antitoxin CcdA
MNYIVPGKKKPLNLLVDEKLLADAKAAGLNLSATLDRALRKEMAIRWSAENAEAIKVYNESIDRDGVWLDEFRSW